VITNLNTTRWNKTMPAKRQSYVLPVLDNDEPLATGEGLTRTSKPGSALFHMLVHFKSSRPMRCTIRAISWSQAEAFARNRHPDLASIERLPQHGQVA
jgi:hypothetical protein